MRLVALIFLMLVAGCTSVQKSQQIHREQLVAVSDIIGAMKCAFSLALVEERNSYERLNGRVVDIELIFKLVDTSNADFSLDAQKAGPFVFALGASGMGSLLPSFKTSVHQSNTITTTIKGRLGLADYGDQACLSIPEHVRAEYGFERWLATVIGGLNVNAGRPPYGVVDSIVYDGAFGVTKKSGGSAGIDFVFFSGNFGADISRNDIQQIKFTIAPPSDNVPYPEFAAFIPGQQSRTSPVNEDGDSDDGETESTNVPDPCRPVPEDPDSVGPLDELPAYC